MSKNNYIVSEYPDGVLTVREYKAGSIKWYIHKNEGIRPIKINILGDWLSDKHEEIIEQELIYLRSYCQPFKTDYNNYIFINNVNYSNFRKL